MKSLVNENKTCTLDPRLGPLHCHCLADEPNQKSSHAQHKPDLLLVGGISNDLQKLGSLEKNLDAIRKVIRQAQALGCEVVLLSPPHSVDWRPYDPEHPDADIPRAVWNELTLDSAGIQRLCWTPYRDLAKDVGVVFWNLTVPTVEAQ